jgi:hypothetical protein
MVAIGWKKRHTVVYVMELWSQLSFVVVVGVDLVGPPNEADMVPAKNVPRTRALGVTVCVVAIGGP